jgi:hypothetical protein
MIDSPGPDRTVQPRAAALWSSSRALSLRMGLLLGFVVSSLASLSPPARAAESPGAVAAGEKRREELPLGGDFRPRPEIPAFVVVGHGGRILVSRDDGVTWTQAFFGHPAGDHGVWSTRTMTYHAGVFVVAFGWGAPTSWIASEDGVRWRHLTSGDVRLPDAKGNPRVMPGTWGLAGGKGTILGTGYMTTAATTDLGRTFTGASLWGAFKNDPRQYKLVTHHLDPVYCGDESGRFLALGDNRGPEGPRFGHLFASDDLGQTWKWLNPRGLEASNGRGTLVAGHDRLVMTDADSANSWTSIDAGETWSGPFPTGTKGRATLSVVGREYWLAGRPPRASSDGQTWRDLPATVPAGQIIAADSGTLISVHPQRTTIQRSVDRGMHWQEVYGYQPDQIEGGAQGLRDGAFGYLTKP